MKAFSPSKVPFSPLLLVAALLLHARAVASTATDPSSSAYKPTSAVEERWMAEEEFHGASSSAESRRRHDVERRRGKERGRDPRPSSFPGHDEGVGERSWWDDDEGEGYIEGYEGGSMTRAASPSIEVDGDVTGNGRHRLRVWKNGRRKESPPSAPSDGSSAKAPTKVTLEDDGVPTSDYDEEHPMRTDEWRLDVRLSRLFPKEEADLFPECHADDSLGRRTKRAAAGSGYRKRQVMQFARNGYVKVLDEGVGGGGDRGGGGKKPTVGRWRMGHSGLAFDVPVQVNMRRRKGGDDNNDERSRVTVLHYHADIHLNKFGERPRMFRGVITRDRHSSFLPANFLRPVIGTFSAEGIGRDTADTSYRERAISLSRQQVIEDARKDAR